MEDVPDAWDGSCIWYKPVRTEKIVSIGKKLKATAAMFSVLCRFGPRALKSECGFAGTAPPQNETREKRSAAEGCRDSCRATREAFQFSFPRSVPGLGMSAHLPYAASRLPDLIDPPLSLIIPHAHLLEAIS